MPNGFESIFGQQREALERGVERGVTRARRRLGAQRSVFTSFGSPVGELGFQEIETAGLDALQRGLANIAGVELQLRLRQQEIERQEALRRAEIDEARRAQRRGAIFGLAGGALGGAVAGPIGFGSGAAAGGLAGGLF